MGRRMPRDLRPFMEECESRELLSAITDVMSANSLAESHRAASNRQTAFTAASQALGARSSNQSIALPTNQGPQGVNLALAPTGTLTRREQKRERFVARYVGTYVVGAGRTSTEGTQTLITATGSANTMLHSDIQMLLVTPNDPTLPISGVSSIFDRNINNNTVLGLDLAAPSGDVNSLGLPDQIPTMTVDVNISSGAYVEGFSQGLVNIHYIPSAKRTPGVLAQGKAVVTIHARIYSANASLILRNANINP